MPAKRNPIDTPFVKKFDDNGFYYIYDVNTNQVVEVDKPVFDIIDYCEQGHTGDLEIRFQDIHEPPVIKRSIVEIKKANEQLGLFSGIRPKKVTMGIGTPQHIKDVHKLGMQQLVLEVTRECNLDCAYCATSGKYRQSNRPRLNMSAETCKKAIDFYLERTGKNEKAFITFYGGEPMLRFDLIKSAVSYVKNKLKPGKCQFNMTTNGTIMDRDRLDFLIENDIAMMVSLDGPETVNDRYRKFRKGGGTFKKILENLELIRNRNYHYFTGKISISAVMAPPYSEIEDIRDFFSTHPAVKEISHGMRFNAVDTMKTSFFEDFCLKDGGEELERVEIMMMKRLKDAILNNDLKSLTIEKQKLYTILYNLARRPIKSLHEYVHPFGACHIGLRRLFVDVTGKFNVCEKVHRNYHIGDIESGFDYDGMVRYYQAFDGLLEDCNNCWAMNHCERCWASLGDIGEGNEEEKEMFCSRQKGIVGKALIFYTRLLREAPDCMKAFNNVMIA